MTAEPSDTDLLRQIVERLDRLDRRDRLRTWGGFFRSLLGIAPALFFLWAAWYGVTHIDDIIRKVAAESAKATAQYTQQQTSNFVEEMQKYFKR